MSHEALILIVDDIKDNRDAIKLALRKSKYEFMEAEDGKEGVQLAQRYIPDVVLMDAMMPIMDGFEATKLLRENQKTNRIPILMITALNQREDKLKALDCGVNDFISKPFDRLELSARCKSYVEMSSLNKNYILATLNPTTDLPNKTALLKEINNCTNPKLLISRIDEFEVIEEFYTEEVAQEIEKEFAKMIPEIIPDECEKTKIFHTSEGEFAILIDDVDNILSQKRIQLLCNIFYSRAKESTIKLVDYEYDISITLSFSDDSKALFEHARVAINHAIKNSKEFVFARDIVDIVHKESHRNISCIKMIKIALAKNKMIPYFQPIYNNKTKTIEKYETLVRMINEKDKVITPFHFLDIAKKGKYYTQITHAVIDQSFEKFRNTKYTFTINISTLDIEDEGTSAYILSKMKDNPEIVNRLVFELLEDEKAKDFEVVRDFIKKIKEMGAQVAIDDFGSGYSSFERLLDFQPDILKIDGSLIKNIETDSYSRSIVETIQSFADKIGVKTVAEFVADETIFKIINEIGIDFSQGYFIGKPSQLSDEKI